MKVFEEKELEKLFKPKEKSTKADNGQVTIIGGSTLFHGAPILAAKTASRIADMVFFASPEPGLSDVAAKMKATLSSFIWVPWGEVGEYIQKSDAVLIGSGFMRYRIERGKRQDIGYRSKMDEAGKFTKKITEELLQQFSAKQWVIDAGSLSVMEAESIPKNAIVTPNRKEFELLFDQEVPEGEEKVSEGLKTLAKKHQCLIVLKTEIIFVASPEEVVLVKGGNAGLTKGGVGDVLSGLIVGLVAKNPPALAAQAGAFIWKKAAEELFKKVGFSYNADDLSEEIPEILGKYWR
jgi:hydroxyethylthiazole kinase-like uncharacterized protein yjeF